MQENYEKQAMKVSLVSIIGNFILTALKLLAGIVAHSGAMISDAIHSASDVFSTFVVIIGIKISSKESDKDHPYGHERLECVAAIVLATILAATGLGIDLLHTRVFGKKIYVDIEIRADGEQSLRDAHRIAEHVHDSIEKTFPKVKHIMVHVNPGQA